MRAAAAASRRDPSSATQRCTWPWLTAEAAQLLERPGGPRVGQLGGQPEGPLPDTQGVLAAGLETQGLVERHQLAAAGPQR